ncbi:expressed unknown protein [Ectocarpus siliculosus]|uniref:Uncharacterized protein n=1 Tax=Ectocarpus siliculosus TaxID=2880 RepID=D7FR37_ECTSI|nr:expressed unknown protein [Ectocarpus siliculosus]|eukprot:CBJ26104.1 expressed unknown protein [Ectocarpus siliculosus]
MRVFLGGGRRNHGVSFPRANRGGGRGTHHAFPCLGKRDGDPRTVGRVGHARDYHFASSDSFPFGGRRFSRRRHHHHPAIIIGLPGPFDGGRHRRCPRRLRRHLLAGHRHQHGEHRRGRGRLRGRSGGGTVMRRDWCRFGCRSGRFDVRRRSIGLLRTRRRWHGYAAGLVPFRVPRRSFGRSPPPYYRLARRVCFVAHL